MARLAANPLTMLYNTDPSLWRGFARTYPNGTITVQGGYLFCSLEGDAFENTPRARFESTAGATEALLAAGWQQTGFGIAPVFAVKP